MSSQADTLSIPSQYNAFEILPKDASEQADERMPKTVGHAFLIFTQTDEAASAERCKLCMDRYLQLLAAGPTGSLIVNVGQACLCWSCGFVGLPGNAEEFEGIESESGEGQVRSLMPPGGPGVQCRNCKQAEKTNWIIGRQGDGPLPFLEAAQPRGAP